MDQRTKGKLEMIIAILWDELKKERRWAVANGKRFLPRPFRITCEQLAEWSGFSMEQVEEIDKLFVECNLNITREWLPYLRELRGFERNRVENYVSIVAEVIFQFRLGGVRMSCFEDYDIYLENKYVGEVNEEAMFSKMRAYVGMIDEEVSE